MKKSILFSLVALSLLNAGDRFSIETGYTNESLVWNFAANGIDVLSELSFEESEFVFTKLGLEHDINEKWLAGGYFGYGSALEGWVQDSDYNGNGRTLEFSRSISSTDDSSFIDTGVYVGKKYQINTATTYTPKLEYSLLYQKYTIKDGEQIIDTVAPVQLGSIAGLDSSYTSFWNTGFLGTDIDYALNDKTTLGFGAYLGLGYYYGEGRWNLRADLEDKSFEHTGAFWATKLSVNLKHKLNENYEMFGGYRYTYSYLENGDNVQFLTDGTRPKSNLNEVERVENRVNIGVSYRF